jgi:hypothetical protein
VPGQTHELGDQRAQRDHHAGVSGGVGDDAQVLVMQVNAEAGGELVPDHAGGLAVEDPVAGQPAREHLDGWFEVHRVGVQEGQGFGDEFDGAGHDQLIRRLHALPRAGRANVYDGRAERLQDRTRGLEVLGCTADHDREHSLDRALLAAADGCVQRPYAGLGRGSSHGPGGGWGDAAHVDEQGTFAGGGEHPIRAIQRPRRPERPATSSRSRRHPVLRRRSTRPESRRIPGGLRL